MACPRVTSGDQFLASVLSHIDCQAQSIGSFGFGALASANSPIAGLLLTLLTLFVAIWGIRLMLGDALTARDGISALLKVGIVLTLATSWPAWRTLAYDVVFKGPGEMSASIAGGAGLPYGPTSLERRLQNLDDGIVALTAFGSGRLTGGIAGSTDIGDTAQGVAIPDQSGLGLGRVAYLVGVIAPLGITRLGGGILLALAPLVAGLLLFGATRGLFFGYLRALGFCALGTMGLALVYATQLGVMEPWLGDTLVRREANALMPAAPTELLVLTLAFLVLALGWLLLLGKLLFFGDAGARSAWIELPSTRPGRIQSVEPGPGMATTRNESARAHMVAGAIASSLAREERLNVITSGGNTASDSRALNAQPGFAATGQAARLGGSYRRQTRRVSAAAGRRDAKS